jgi:hypothetical protein
MEILQTIIQYEIISSLGPIILYGMMVKTIPSDK